MRPDMYLGSTQSQNSSHIAYTPEQGITYQTNTFSTASQQLFYEIIENSIDNFNLSNHPKDYYISITLQPRQFIIKNNGRIFNLDENPNTLNNINRVVSVLNTSSHYDKAKGSYSAGMNGLGAKLVCLTQKLFQITVCNNGLQFISTWYNMMQQHDQQLNYPAKSEHSFQVYVQLLDKGTTINIHNIPKQFNFEDLDIPAIQFYIQHIPFLGIQNIILNGKLIQYKSIQELYNPEQYCQIKHQSITIHLLNKSLLKDNYCFINGILCFNATCFNDIRKQIREAMKLKSDDGKFTYKIIVIGYWPDIKFSDQTKDKLTTTFKNIPVDKPVQNFIHQILSNKKVIHKDKFICDKYIKANHSLDNNSNCSLILTEGDSAASLFQQIPEFYRGNFFDYYGLFPLKGKVKNTYNDDDIFSINNEELKNIIQIIGFQNGVHYNKDNISNLKYKQIIIASDYDDDGFHIKGLILNVFLQYWPELMDLNFFKQFTTPIIVADNIEFFQEQEFRKQQQTHNFHNVKYLKGLGSIDKRMPLFRNICDNFNNYAKPITYNSDKYKYLLDALFNNRSINRKNFIMNYIPQYIDHTKDYILIEDILEQQVVQYSFKTLERAIPCFIDGLKDSQRKIIYHALKKGNFKEKVANFASDVSNKYDYHHGENSLCGAIVQLAQECVGTNNCPLLFGEGSFGNDWNPESHAAYRYIYVAQNIWLKKFFKKDDSLLYKYRLSDDGKQIEPQQLYPIVPIFLLNGITGIASGWSSNVPCFNLKDIVNYILHYLNNEQLPILNPSYNNYKGTTRFLYNDKQQQYFENIGLVQEDDNFIYIFETHLNKMYKAKLYESLQKNYKIFPDQIGKNIIKISKKQITPDQFREIYNKYIYNCTKCENMTFIQYSLQNNQNDYQIKPIKFSNIYSLINSWIDQRLYYYIVRKEKLLRQCIYNYIIQFNYKQVNDKKLLKDHDNEQLTNERLSYLTPFSKIKYLSEQFPLAEDSMKQIQEQLLQQQQTQQSTDPTEYNYITEKSVKFFVKKQYNLQSIIDEYTRLYSTAGKTIWINELKEILDQ